MKKAKITFQSLYQRILRVTRGHFYLILAYAAATIAFDSWNLFTHEVIAKRWTYGGVLAVACCLIWFGIKRYARSYRALTYLTYALITVDILFASLNVMIDRGMASKAVMLFALPLVVAVQLRRRSVVLVTTGLSIAAYTTVAVRYFHTFYGEGLRIQLYGEIGFYSALLCVLALLLLPLTENE